MARTRTPPWGKSFDSDTSKLWRTKGRTVWERLGKALISPAEKSLVAADPDLCQSTMDKMIALRGGMDQINPIKFFFSDPSPEDASDRNDDIGYPTLSLCIKQDRNATWAEVVARYSILRRVPFLETAIALKELEKNGQLIYFDDGSKLPISWSPRSRHTTNEATVDDEWDTLESLQP